MPGTGKSFLIAVLIKILSDHKCKVLISTYTNSALDNIIIKLLELFPTLKSNIIRYATSKYKVADQCKEVCYDKKSLKEKNITNMMEFKKFMETKYIFATTSLSIN